MRGAASVTILHHLQSTVNNRIDTAPRPLSNARKLKTLSFLCLKRPRKQSGLPVFSGQVNTVCYGKSRRKKRGNKCEHHSQLPRTCGPAPAPSFCRGAPRALTGKSCVALQKAPKHCGGAPPSPTPASATGKPNLSALCTGRSHKTPSQLYRSRLLQPNTR